MDPIEEKKHLVFYEVMKYPVPAQQDFFLFEKKIEPLTPSPYNGEGRGEVTQPWAHFSRTHKNEYLDEFIWYINKYGRLYKSLPFIKNIFLCNSITFNSLKKDSDIDLFIITKKNSLWRARLRSVLLFTLTGLKRSVKKKQKKFCLSFYITEDHKNLYSIMLSKTDIYLNYWLAHLVPLYSEDETLDMYKDNSRFSIWLQNHPKKYCINIGNKHFIWDTKAKKIIEFIFWWWLWSLREVLIKLLRLPVLISKTKHHGEKGRGIIINDHMLKFHADARKKISFLYNTIKKQYK